MSNQDSNRKRNRIITGQGLGKSISLSVTIRQTKAADPRAIWEFAGTVFEEIGRDAVERYTTKSHLTLWRCIRDIEQWAWRHDYRAALVVTFELIDTEIV